MTDIKYVTYCGLYCELCATRNRIPGQADALWQSMKKEGYDQWGEFVYGDGNFKKFWDFLGKLKDYDNICPGCRQEGGYPDCKIKKCALKKNIEVCALCEEFPCDLIRRFSKRYITIIPDGMRIKEIGLEAWIEEQKERAETGFCYADIRCQVDWLPE